MEEEKYRLLSNWAVYFITEIEKRLEQVTKLNLLERTEAQVDEIKDTQ